MSTENTPGTGLDRAKFQIVAIMPDGECRIDIPANSRTAASLRKLVTAILKNEAPDDWYVVGGFEAR